MGLLVFLSIHIEGHLGCLWFLMSVSKAAKASCTGFCVDKWEVCSSIGWILRSMIAGS